MLGLDPNCINHALIFSLIILTDHKSVDNGGDKTFESNSVVCTQDFYSQTGQFLAVGWPGQSGLSRGVVKCSLF